MKIQAEEVKDNMLKKLLTKSKELSSDDTSIDTARKKEATDRVFAQVNNPMMEAIKRFARQKAKEHIEA